jgi:hypothetical protein
LDYLYIDNEYYYLYIDNEYYYLSTIKHFLTNITMRNKKLYIDLFLERNEKNKNNNNTNNNKKRSKNNKSPKLCLGDLTTQSEA